MMAEHPRRGCWVVTNVTNPIPAVRLLWSWLEGATMIVTVGGRRSWFAAARAETEEAPVFGVGGELGEQRLRASRTAMELLTFAVMQDAPEPFCAELRILAGDEILLRWCEPPSGRLRLSSSISNAITWEIAQQLGAERAWDLGAV